MNVNSLILLVVAALISQTNGQACPEDIAVGNPINYSHLFKEQIDADWSFFNAHTTCVPKAQSLDATGLIESLVFFCQDTNLPVRTWMYAIEVTHLASGQIASVNSFHRLRVTIDPAGVATTAATLADILLPNKTAAFTFTDSMTAVEATAGCCQYKLEYIYYHYLYVNYFKDGNGSTCYNSLP